jgi:hypothetical protein
MDEIIEKEISEIKDKKAKANESAKYCTDRIDIVVISLSTGAIALTINIFSNLKACDYSNLVWFLKLSLLSFILSIISNLISQLTAFNHFKLKIERFDKQSTNLKNGETKDNEETELYKIKMLRFNRITDILNKASTYLLIIGILLLLFYFTLKY